MVCEAPGGLNGAAGTPTDGSVRCCNDENDSSRRKMLMGNGHAWKGLVLPGASVQGVRPRAAGQFPRAIKHLGGF